ncbi:hypothetical protein LB572_31750 [Mesorhizobium sp. BH1-1-5]|uniref:hypothetical protein n=1 Tax=Mesorhizobium sp. BH1-1-5 TaxID=2876661 RepID=UPI001CCA6976|nr:hypothetical protein [Mesorhizobium sp. BH1-1-5]MBZ9991675.1 hypothetical protein [Mesorhizobium sp. BH1-1-5]
MRNSVGRTLATPRGQDLAEARHIGKFKVNDYWMTKYFTAIGSAISYLPDFFIEYEVAAGALVPVPPERHWEKRSIYALSTRHKGTAARA